MGQSTRVLVQRCPGSSPVDRHFENRRGEGPGDEVELFIENKQIYFIMQITSNMIPGGGGGGVLNKV